MTTAGKTPQELQPEHTTSLIFPQTQHLKTIIDPWRRNANINPDSKSRSVSQNAGLDVPPNASRTTPKAKNVRSNAGDFVPLNATRYTSRNASPLNAGVHVPPNAFRTTPKNSGSNAGLDVPPNASRTALMNVSPQALNSIQYRYPRVGFNKGDIPNNDIISSQQDRVTQDDNLSQTQQDLIDSRRDSQSYQGDQPQNPIDSHRDNQSYLGDHPQSYHSDPQGILDYQSYQGDPQGIIDYYNYPGDHPQTPYNYQTPNGYWNQNPQYFQNNGHNTQSLMSMTSDEKKLKADLRSNILKFKGLSDKKREQQTFMYLDMLAVFANYITQKHEKWTKDIDNTNGIRSKIYELSGTINSLPERSVERAKYEDQLIYQVKRMARAYMGKSNNNFTSMKSFFVKRGRRGISHILRYIQDNAYLLKPGLPDKEEMADLIKNYKEIVEKFNKLNFQISTSNNNFYARLAQIADKTMGNFSTIDEEKKADIDTVIDATYDKIRKQEDKINSFYQLRYSQLEMIIDTQLYVIYMLKAIRLLFAYVALFLATRMFVPIYEDTVYDEKKDPPPLWKYMLIFLGFDFSLNVFLIVLLYLLKYLFKSEDNSFVIDNYMITNHVYDYAIGTGVTMLLGVLIGQVIIRKKYFKYKYEGMRAIRAFEKMVFYVAMVNIFIPYYLMF